MLQKRAHVIGLGISGISAAKLLMDKGWQVVASDDKTQLDNSDEVLQLQQRGMEVHLGGHDRAAGQTVQFVIVSPGVRFDADVLKLRRSQGVELIGEAELGWRYCQGKLVAVTGSNGKSTVTAMLGEIFAQTDQPSFTCGNIGLPICDIASQTTNDSLIAMEISSYQLMSIKDFKPQISVLTGISPDHLDYHGTFDNYLEAKARIWMNQTSSEYLVYNSDDAIVRRLVENARPQKVPISSEMSSECNTGIMDNSLYANPTETLSAKVAINDFKLPGRHNQANALAAMCAALLIGVSPDQVEAGVKAFEGLPHRLEKVRKLDQTLYINDSKATNPESTICALEAMDRPVVLIAGGLSKGGGFKMLRDLISAKVRQLILIGECAGEIEADLGDVCPVQNVAGLKEAVNLAAISSYEGYAVLLSPMAASFDMFKNYEDRGDQFKAFVNKL